MLQLARPHRGGGRVVAERQDGQDPAAPRPRVAPGRTGQRDRIAAGATGRLLLQSPGPAARAAGPDRRAAHRRRRALPVFRLRVHRLHVFAAGRHPDDAGIPRRRPDQADAEAGSRAVRERRAAAAQQPMGARTPRTPAEGEEQGQPASGARVRGAPLGVRRLRELPAQRLARLGRRPAIQPAHRGARAASTPRPCGRCGSGTWPGGRAGRSGRSRRSSRSNWRFGTSRRRRRAGPV